MDLVIFGNGGHGRVCSEIAQLRGFNVMTADREPGADFTVESPNEMIGLNAMMFIAIGNNDIREAFLLDALESGFAIPSFGHPGAIVSQRALIGGGSVVMAGAVINPGARIGLGAIVNTSASIDHDCKVGDHAQICPGVHLAGNVTVGAGAFIGTGAIVIPGVTIGDRAVIGAGALIKDDVPRGAKIVRDNDGPSIRYHSLHMAGGGNSYACH